ncbi:MAG: hypothetical protein RLZZ15_4276 [Verrucomicrobiota bacterium]|jgi:SET domain-containing protein
MEKNVFVADCALGRGLFAARAFASGERILEFTGPVITLAKTIAKGEAEANPLQFDDDRYFDLPPPVVFLNHSCAPNTGVTDGRWLIALRKISADEELRFDYSTTMQESRWTMACRCGAANCRGVVADFRLLPIERQEHYLRLGIVQPFIVRALNEARARAAR